MKAWGIVGTVLPAVALWTAGCSGQTRTTVVAAQPPGPVAVRPVQAGSPQPYGDQYSGQPPTYRGQGGSEGYTEPYNDQAYGEDYSEQQYSTENEAPVYVEPEEPAAEQDSRPQVNFDMFYSNLAPEGLWLQYGSYGWVWMPRDVPVGWRPYTQGRWVWTDDYGWMWVSSEPWGWATYHYGRWGFDPNLGWFWVPGAVWSPAWVTWRTGEDYIGWAPLPPQAVWYPDRGLVWAGGSPEHLSWRRWVFVPERHFVSRDLAHYAVIEPRNVNILQATRSLTDVVRAHNRIVNRGVDIKRLERVVQAPIPRVHVQHITDLQAARHEKLSGDTVRVYAPRIHRVSAHPAPPPAVIEQSRKEARDLEGRQAALQGQLDQRIKSERQAFDRQQQEERQQFKGNPQDLQRRLQAERQAFDRQQQTERQQVTHRVQVERQVAQGKTKVQPAAAPPAAAPAQPVQGEKHGVTPPQGQLREQARPQAPERRVEPRPAPPAAQPPERRVEPTPVQPAPPPSERRTEPAPAQPPHPAARPVEPGHAQPAPPPAGPQATPPAQPRPEPRPMERRPEAMPPPERPGHPGAEQAPAHPATPAPPVAEPRSTGRHPEASPAPKAQEQPTPPTHHAAPPPKPAERPEPPRPAPAAHEPARPAPPPSAAPPARAPEERAASPEARPAPSRPEPAGHEPPKDHQPPPGQ